MLLIVDSNHLLLQRQGIGHAISKAIKNMISYLHSLICRLVAHVNSIIMHTALTLSEQVMAIAVQINVNNFLLVGKYLFIMPMTALYQSFVNCLHIHKPRQTGYLIKW